LLSIPQRVGSVMLMAVVPHATRALAADQMRLSISRREHALLTGPFLLAAAAVWLTPLIPWIFDALGRHVYAQSASLLALALLAGPARILYGLVEGILIAYGDARFLAINAMAVAALASCLMLAAAAAGSMQAAFAIFVAAVWAIYLLGLARIGSLAVASSGARGTSAAASVPRPRSSAQ
jgi:O-antigen/teichoic acid export membrane protein